MSANSPLGRFVVDFSHFLHFVKIHHQGVAVSCTGIICGGLYIRNVRRCEHRLIETQNLVARESQVTTEETVTKLNELMNFWSADGEKKDQQLAKLHGQNIQQTRSLDRIMAMLRTCRVEVPVLPNFSQMRKQDGIISRSSNMSSNNNSNNTNGNSNGSAAALSSSSASSSSGSSSNTTNPVPNIDSPPSSVSAQLNSTSMEIAASNNNNNSETTSPSLSSSQQVAVVSSAQTANNTTASTVVTKTAPSAADQSQRKK